MGQLALPAMVLPPQALIQRRGTPARHDLADRIKAGPVVNHAFAAVVSCPTTSGADGRLIASPGGVARLVALEAHHRWAHGKGVGPVADVALCRAMGAID